MRRHQNICVIILLGVTLCTSLLREDPKFPGRMRDDVTLRVLTGTNATFNYTYPYEHIHSITFDRVVDAKSGLTYLGSCSPESGAPPCNDTRYRLTFVNHPGNPFIIYNNVTSAEAGLYRTRVIQQGEVTHNPNLTDIFTTLEVYERNPMPVSVNLRNVTSTVMCPMSGQTISTESYKIFFCSGESGSTHTVVVSLDKNGPTANIQIGNKTCNASRSCSTQVVDRQQFDILVDWRIQAFTPCRIVVIQECSTANDNTEVSNECSNPNKGYYLTFVLFISLLVIIFILGVVFLVGYRRRYFTVQRGGQKYSAPDAGPVES